MKRSIFESGGVFRSPTRNPAQNLALEEYFLSGINRNKEILFLYENNPAIVIGRFQNPWRECRTGLARREAVSVLRRISGGGTVVHGPGNLNFAVISGKKYPSKEQNLDRVIKALSRLNVVLRRNDRLDLLISRPEAPDIDSWRKVSGSAFRQTSRASMHHATLLVNADLAALKRLLNQAPRDIRSRGVLSRPSPVSNLSDSSGKPGMDDVMAALASEWGQEGGPVLLDVEKDVQKAEFLETEQRLVSEAWIWGKTPSFVERFSNLPSHPDEVWEISVSEGRIDTVPEAASALRGCPYHGHNLLQATGKLDAPWLEELASRVDGDGLPDLHPLL